MKKPAGKAEVSTGLHIQPYFSQKGKHPFDEIRWESRTAEIKDPQRASILAAVSASDYKKSPKAKNWVGCAVAYAVGLDLDDNVQRKRAARLVTALIREGALVEREERDPVRRELAVFVRAA